MLVELLYLVKILLVDVTVAKSLLEDIRRVANVLVVLIDNILAPFVDVATIYALVIFEDNTFLLILSKILNIEIPINGGKIYRTALVMPCPYIDIYGDAGDIDKPTKRACVDICRITKLTYYVYLILLYSI